MKSTAGKVLITGSSGMLGVDLSAELSDDCEVIGFDLVNSPHSIVHRFYKGDITDGEGIGKAISEARPDIVVHTAAWTDVDGCELDAEKAYRVNSDGTGNVALGCRDAGAILIYISTDFVFDGTKAWQYNEEDVPLPLSVYGDSKLKGEEAVRDSLEGYFIVRTSWLYGKWGKNFVNTIISKAKAEKVLKVVDDQVGAPTYTKDLARAIHALVDKVVSRKSQVTSKEYGVYHVSNSGSVSWYEYAKEISMLANLPAKVAPISSQELARPARRPAMSVLDNSKFLKFTGHKMRNWEEALKDYINVMEEGAKRLTKQSE